MRGVIGLVIITGCGSTAVAPTPPSATPLLATEKLAGNVLVPRTVTLHATAAGARGAPGTTERSDLFAVRVLAEHGDSVEVQTAPVDDCIEWFGRPYELTVFVRRDQLALRAKRDVTATYPDGSAVAIDRGAPIVAEQAGFAWESAALAATPVKPTADLVTYATPPQEQRAALPPVSGPRMVCEDDEPVTEGDYRATHPRSEDSFDGQHADEWLAWCGISNGSYRYPEPTTPIPPPMLNGAPADWPSTEDAVVSMTDGGFVADVDVGCGHIRYVVQREALDSVGMMGGIGGGTQEEMWQPAPGPVTWPDGSPAGRYTADYEQYAHATEVGDRLCVEIRGIAERVCHPKATSKRVTGMAGSAADD